MKIKFAIIDTYYPSFLSKFEKKNRKLSTYSSKLKSILSQDFGTSNFYSSNLNSLGHKAVDIIANYEDLQRCWAMENQVEIEKRSALDKLRLAPFIHKFIGRPNWSQDIVIEQIKQLKPDITLIHDLSFFHPETLYKLKSFTRLLIGQIASPLPQSKFLNPYDLILTSFPHFVRTLGKLGINAEYFKIGFEETLIDRIEASDKQYETTFIGSFSPVHSQGTKELERAAKQIPIHIWGPGLNIFHPASPLMRHYHGQAWGNEMYKILCKSKIVINRHSQASEKYANNMRLFEVTGMGTMLLTDWKENLKDLFIIDKEIVTYRSSDEMIEKVRYYLKNPVEREKIAKAGQKRTLNDHTYKKRMVELVKIVNRYL